MSPGLVQHHYTPDLFRVGFLSYLFFIPLEVLCWHW